MAKVIKISPSICRLCLKTIWAPNTEVVNDSQIDIIQVVLPQIALDHSKNVKICEDCAKLLEKSFNFKSKCLEIEDSIHDYKQNVQARVDLEEVLGISSNGSAKCVKICRMCLRYLENSMFVELEKQLDLKFLIEKCVPEIDIELTLNPVICQVCEQLLTEIYNFTTLCNDNEKCNIHKTQNVYPAPEPETCDEVQFISDSKNQTNETAAKKHDTKKIVKKKQKRLIEAIFCNYCNYAATGKVTLLQHMSKCKQNPYLPKSVPKPVPKPVPSNAGRVFCKFCCHAYPSEFIARRHISKCPQSPFLQNGPPKPPPANKPKVFCKYCLREFTTGHGTRRHMSVCPENPHSKKPQNAANSTPATSEKDADDVEIIDDENSFVKMEIRYNDFADDATENAAHASAASSHLEAAKVSPATVKTEMVDDEDQWRNILLAIKNNQKKLIWELEVLTCNGCTFNSRSCLKMALHGSSHTGVGDKSGADCRNGYRTAFYCVNCSESYGTAESLRKHVGECPRPDDETVFLFKVGDVMHCTRCYFDSDDSEMVIKHLRKCGDVVVENLEL